ncbi:peroxisomal acyl-coenzyme A oxidase 3-like [Chironomus tepperi]|uniref:peroxisomal acyl-coenzyme A oxidase 3-like n=1 Tax=Chironomus tepperi TaxID=113505 RepID=UPI00391F9828
MSQGVNNTCTKKSFQPLNDPIFSRKDIFPDLHLLDGPLKPYRFNSSFDWRKMKLIVDSAATWDVKFRVWNFMEGHPLFKRSHETLPMDEQRRLASKQVFTLYNEKLYGMQEYIENPELSVKYSTAIGAFEPSISVKYGIGFGMFPSVLRSNGTERVEDLIYDNTQMKNFGCFALTEIAHGSNTQAMKTTATYDPSSKSFILNTPNFEAAKCWVGNLGKTATHAIVYAQLYTPDGKCHGLNSFVVPVRDPKNMLVYPGVVIGDLGEKVSLNGIDNGFVMFNNYKIPKDYLLSKTGDVDDAGNFVTQFKDPKKRMGISFAALSGGRVGICEIAANYGVMAITIAIRYSASRKQFGPENSDIEYPVLEYQSQQYRLIPHLATIYAIKFFSNWIAKEYFDMLKKTLVGEKVSPETGMEMHAISSSGKPICGWMVRDMIQDCREACGGHGYLKCAQLGDLRNNNDPNTTYEGENNVLIQQASNFLIAVRGKGWKSFENASPLGTAAFLKDGDQILNTKWNWSKVGCAMKPEHLLATFNWICAYLLEKTFKRVQSLQQSGQSNFDVRNNTQTFHANNLAIAYGQRQAIAAFLAEIQKLSPECTAERDVLTKLLSLFAANLISTKYIGILYEGGFVTSNGPNVNDLLQTGILGLLTDLKNEAVSLVDSIAPPDFIINSPLGMSDGNVYKHLESFMYQTPDTFTRPSWWKDCVYKDFLTSKL